MEHIFFILAVWVFAGALFSALLELHEKFIDTLHYKIPFKKTYKKCFYLVTLLLLMGPLMWIILSIIGGFLILEWLSDVDHWKF